MESTLECTASSKSETWGFLSPTLGNATPTTQVDSAFYPPWDGKMSTSQSAVMFCGWGVKAGMV